MYLIHKLMNIVVPLTSILAAIFFLPAYLLFKILNTLFKCVRSEDVGGKVVVITGASSGIGEHIAYEYARRGACLALVARRENRLQEVANRARQLGSPDVIVICADVSVVQHCKRFVDETIKHFGRLDHLVNNAGKAPLCIFEDYTCVSDHTSVMNVNFWGSVYSTQFAVPYLRKSKGKIVVISSCAGWFPTPRLSIYGATKAALISFYETLRVELGSDIGITIVTPGLIESEITQGDFLSQAQVNFIPLESTEEFAKATVNGTCRGEKFLIEPVWVRVVYLWSLFCPELIEWSNRLLLITWPRASQTSKKILVAPNSINCEIQPPNLKAD